MFNLPSTNLSFEGHDLIVTDINGVRWLRGNQIGSALELAHSDVAIRKIFNRHRQEFTDEMTAVIEIDTSGGRQLTRLFSSRGAALLAMLAQTPRAARFRAWVLDVLEAAQAPSTPPAVPVAQASIEKLLSPEARAILRLSRLKLKTVEIAKLTDVSQTTVKVRKRALAAAGLLAVRHG